MLTLTRELQIKCKILKYANYNLKKFQIYLVVVAT